jgi:putative membrane protein insertion efficiency factor
METPARTMERPSPSPEIGGREAVVTAGVGTDRPPRRPTPVAWLALGAIRLYKRFVSPLLPSACRFYPTCSEYGYEAIAKYGIIKGGWLALWRLARCNPFGRGGFDPVE